MLRDMPIPLPTIVGTYRCVARWLDSTTSQTAVNVMHISSGVTSSTIVQASNAIKNSWLANMQLFMPTTVTLTAFDITPLDGHSATQTFGTGGGAPFKGGSAVDFAPAVSALIRIQTGLRGRENRGRVYLPFVSESQMTNGSLISADPPLVTTAWNSFVTALGASSPVAFTFGVAAYDRAGGGAGAHFTVTTGVFCETVLATQRRRQSRLR
jgi:hypothetical protein